MSKPPLMPRPRYVLAALMLATAPLAAFAQDPARPRPGGTESDDIARYCAALGPSIVEARAAYQLRRLEDLEVQMREQAEKLEAKESAAREWVTKREQMMKAAADDVVAIYAKMSPEAAAGELANMDEVVAASVLAKLKPGVAGAILSEIPPEKAAKLSTLIAGAQAADKS